MCPLHAGLSPVPGSPSTPSSFSNSWQFLHSGLWGQRLDLRHEEAHVATMSGFWESWHQAWPSRLPGPCGPRSGRLALASPCRSATGLMGPCAASPAHPVPVFPGVLVTVIRGGCFCSCCRGKWGSGKVRDTPGPPGRWHRSRPEPRACASDSGVLGTRPWLCQQSEKHAGPLEHVHPSLDRLRSPLTILGPERGWSPRAPTWSLVPVGRSPAWSRETDLTYQMAPREGLGASVTTGS